jgi:predicted kinase
MNPGTDDNWRFPFCPEPPAWRLDWSAIIDRFSWIRAMQGCAQDPQWHAEGDVLTHTRMVCEALCQLPAWRELDPVDRSIVFAATLLHDVAKPMVTCQREGRIRAPHHARKGALWARACLANELLPTRSLTALRRREEIVNLVRWHGLPLYLMRNEDPNRELFAASQLIRLNRLALIARADVLGRICHDRDQLLEKIGWFEELAREQQCLESPRAFASDHTRFTYFFHQRALDPDVEIYDDSRCQVVVMSGLPGAGKDHWIQHEGRGWPVVSLDAIRRKGAIPAADNQGVVVQAAHEKAREYLRSGTSFIWNATNTTRRMRRQLIRLLRDYKAKIRVVYVECLRDEIRQRNRCRPHPVPERIIDRLLDRLEPPDLTEAHQVELVCSSNQASRQKIDRGARPGR